jgi:hypothetical protein
MLLVLGSALAKAEVALRVRYVEDFTEDCDVVYT